MMPWLLLEPIRRMTWFKWLADRSRVDIAGCGLLELFIVRRGRREVSREECSCLQL